MNQKIIVLFCLFFSICSLAQEFTSSDLALKDLDQMNKIIKGKIIESRKAVSNKEFPLVEGLKIIYSRPNQDGLIEKVISSLKSELEEQEYWEKAIDQIVVESINTLNDKKSSRKRQLTSWIILENIISEMKPKKNDSFEKSILEKIYEAKIEISSAAKNERKINMMNQAKSPSAIAAQILGKKIK